MVPPCIVMEFLHNGSLADVIKKRPQELTFERSMVILQGVANGMVLLPLLHTLECVLIFWNMCMCRRLSIRCRRRFCIAT
jgi:serine/threonine protein kinase